jgi:hypothetical protein
MKISLIALAVACAVAGPAFAQFDLPPIVPPHGLQNPPLVAHPYGAMLNEVPIEPLNGATLDLPPVVPPHGA